MDIRCRMCGEPWDIDTFHDIADEQGVTFQQALGAFRKGGCEATGWTRCGPPMDATGRMVADEIYGFMGDDVDGAACDFEMAEQMGLFE